MEIDLSRCQPGTCPAECEGLICPRDTRHTPWYCHGFRQNPEAWGPKIVEGARKDAARVASKSGSGQAIADPIDQWSFVTRTQLVSDTFRLIQALPPDIDTVVAIARSGLLPGADVATYLHLPLRAVSETGGVVNFGHGGRMVGRDDLPPKHVLLIDDTLATGRAMRLCLPRVREAYPDAEITRAAIYAHPTAKGFVDLLVSEYPGEHYLEWNWHDAGHGAACGFDFDGILCRDFTEAECRSTESYRETMARIAPLYLPRRLPVPLIVTARPESTRDLTKAWLGRYGVRVDRLVMGAAQNGHDQESIAMFKAEAYRESSCKLFAESDERQAKIIARKSGKPVLCPAAKQVFSPKPRMPLGKRQRAPKGCMSCR